MKGKGLTATALAALLTLVGCVHSSSTNRSNVSLTVLAASSLEQVLPQVADLFTQTHAGVTFLFSLAGTDQLAAQIQRGAPADVFAGASKKFGDQLFEAKLIEAPRTFCTNQLALVVPASNPAGLVSVKDLSTKPVRLVIGSEAVPIGTYTRTVLSNLDKVYGSGFSTAVLSDVVSNEDSVSSIVAKVESGEADAGFVYITDALAAGSQMRSLTLPGEAQATATYPIAVVRASKNPPLAQQFVDFILTAPVQKVLGDAGFGPPPAG